MSVLNEEIYEILADQVACWFIAHECSEKVLLDEVIYQEERSFIKSFNPNLRLPEMVLTVRPRPFPYEPPHFRKIKLGLDI